MVCLFYKEKLAEWYLNCRSTITFGLAAVLLVLISGQVDAEERNPFLPQGIEDRGWPDVRGIRFDAHSPEIHLADNWPAEGPPVLWVKDLGQGYSAFVAAGDRVYTQAQTLQGQYVYCLAARTGKTVWEYRYDWPYELAGVYPGPRATPTLAEGKVLFAAPSGLVGCLDANKGKLIWSRNVLEEFHGTGGDGFGYACSPTVVDQLVVLPVGGPGASMVALNLADGKTVWQSGDRPASYCPALPIERNGRKLVVGYLENALVIHDLQTGAVLLEHELSEGYDEHSAWPLYREPYLWIAAPFRSGSQLFELPDRFPHSELLKTVWRSRVMSNDVLSSVLVNEQIYGFDIFDQQSKTQRPSRGKFRCIEFLTGKELWEQGSGRPERSNNDITNELGQSGIIVADGKLILLNERGELILLRQNPERCEILSRCNVLSGELTWTPPVLHRGCVFIRNQSRAACVYLGEPDLLPSDQPTLRLAEIPQETYYDWAGQILSVEPEYAFDLPSTDWLIRWYCWSLGLLVASLILAAIPLWWIPSQRRLPTWIMTYRMLAFLAGALGTTWISLWQQDFIFTWPLCLYIVTEPVFASVQFKREQQRSSFWRDYGPLIWLLIVFTVYFLLCRRLSLVFEWAFLAGPIGALPAGWWEWHLKKQTPLRMCFALILKLITFSCFYGSGIAILWLRY
ncbi:outer membrane protein assembly factor BamB family protein [Gimesia panareensis]|uniref:outer membrane protein assembly factor BamB family protein n=1 Tax=Gimesia panareensis TaxID=2527978 RepID=UPI00118D0F48|nr:PQQ-binding-like beta-propeller repeat protein [Gimesia panareensis]QDU49281.1 outer membrane biogenesis protein BamB [Gimesia panareensis]